MYFVPEASTSLSSVLYAGLEPPMATLQCKMWGIV